MTARVAEAASLSCCIGSRAALTPPTSWHCLVLLQDYSMRVLNVALNPPRLGRQTAPNPDQQYSPAEYLEWVPSTGTAARQYTFVANFIGTTMLPVTNLGARWRCA